MRHVLEYCYSPPPPLDGMLILRSVTPQQYVAGTQLYTLMKRDKVEKVPCLREHSDGRGLHPGPPNLEFEVLTARPHTPPPTSRWFIVLQQTWPCSIITESTTSCPTYNTKKLTNIFSCLTVKVDLQIFVSLSTWISIHLIRSFKLAKIFAFAFLLHHVCRLRGTNWKNWEKVAHLTTSTFRL